MLINLRNALMAGKRLPYDAEVEYLESTGTQWIDSGINMTSEDVVECSIWWNVRGVNMNPFGTNQTISGTTYRFSVQCYDNAANDRLNAFWGGTLPTAVFGGAKGTWNDVSLGRGTFKINGSTIQTWSTESFSITTTFAIFAYHTINGFVNPFIGRMRYLRITRNGVLVRDFLPVRKGTVGYLYDRVSGKLFGNDGTGDFVLGPDKN